MNQSGQTSQEARDRTFQSRMEWARTLYDFYKNFMTVALASIAAAAALVGGVYKGAVGINDSWWPQILVGVTIGAFVVTGLMAIQGMHLARRLIFHMHEVNSEADLDKIRKANWGPANMLNRERVWWVVQSSYIAGIITFLVFVVVAGFF